MLTILENTGLSDATTPALIATVTAAGGTFLDDQRLRFPASLVEDALAGFEKNVTLAGQSPEYDMSLSGSNVHMGSGGAAPSVVDLDTGRYRDSMLKDLYDAARIIDHLDHIHFFSRPLVARDMPTAQLLDINTAYACLAAHAGSNLITQAGGMHAALMGCAMESYMIDNDMLGSIMSSLKSLETTASVFSTEAIDRVVQGEGHFLGETETCDRMKSDFLYPKIANRRTSVEWEEDGLRDIQEVAREKTREILKTHFPQHLVTIDQKLRQSFDIRLPVEQMSAH